MDATKPTPGASQPSAALENGVGGGVPSHEVSAPKTSVSASTESADQAASVEQIYATAQISSADPGESSTRVTPSQEANAVAKVAPEDPAAHTARGAKMMPEISSAQVTATSTTPKTPAKVPARKTKAAHMPTTVVADVVLDNNALSAILDWGQSMLIVGADVSLVEGCIREMGAHCGAAYTDVFALSSLIVTTVTMDDGSVLTQSRRIDSTGDTDFHKLDDLFALCRDFCQDKATIQDLQKRRQAIVSRPFPKFALYGGGILSTSCFAVFFGGSFLDAGVSAVFAILVCLMMRFIKPRTPNNNVFNFIAAFVTGIGIALLARVLPSLDISMTIVGVIMILIPGIALTNSARDLISGDIVTGMVGFVESLLWATSLALGYIAALALVP